MQGKEREGSGRLRETVTGETMETRGYIKEGER